MKDYTRRKYLRTIYQLALSKKEVRQIDLALTLGYARSSVSLAVKYLHQQGLINIDGKNLSLTIQGKQEAKLSYQQYLKTLAFVLKLGYDNYQANEYVRIMEEYFDYDFINSLIEKQE
ncbi:MAG: metal-dependent transcriptional regulator [Thomasclavelia sp.]